MRNMTVNPRRRTGLIVAGSVLVIAAAVGASVVAVRSSGSEVDSYPAYAGEGPRQEQTSSPSSAQPTGTSSPAPTTRNDGDTSHSRPKHWPSNMRPGEPVSAEGLKHIEPQRFYWEMVKRQATKPITDLTSTHFPNTTYRLRPESHLYTVTRRIYDYPRQRVTQAASQYNHGLAGNYRCVDGKQYDYSAVTHRWERFEIFEEACTKLDDTLEWTDSTDGITPGGLTPHQADKFIARLLILGTLVHPRRPRLLVDHGHRYIRMVVDFTPVKDANGFYWGAALIDQAYFRAGLPMKPHIFANGFRAGQGMHVIYYIDPISLLPSYSKELGTPALDKQGQVEIRDESSSIYQYRFPSTMPTFTLRGSERIKMDPPEGFRID